MYKFISLLLINTALADYETVITADRINTTRNRSTNKIEIITEEQIDSSYATTLPTLLQETGEVLVSNGSVFLRGADSAHTLVVLDGIVLYDPSNPNRSFDISSLSINNISKIEILKGAQGLLYGANAIGGVIVLTSKSKKLNNLSGSQYISYGTYDTLGLGFQFQKQYSAHQLSLGADLYSTDGYSQANKIHNQNAEDDSQKRYNLNFSSQSELNANSDFVSNIRFASKNLDLDNCGGVSCDSRTNTLQTEELFSHFQYNHLSSNGLDKTHTYFNHGKSSRHNISDYGNSLYKGVIQTFGISRENIFNNTFEQYLNIELQKESNQSSQKNTNASAFAYHKWELNDFILNFGLRVDHNEVFKNFSTYKLATSYLVNRKNILRTSLATGVQAPGLYQLMDATYGNLLLKPEKSRTFEIGHEYHDQNITFSSSAFTTELTDRFQYVDSLKKTINNGSSTINGLEFSLKSPISTTGLTILDTNLPRRPKIHFKNSFFYFDITLETDFVGSRNDLNSLGNTVQTPSYCITHLKYDYRSFNLQIKNIFDTEYEEAYGYGTGGRMITLGYKNNF